MKKIEKLMIANRGEIAVRIIRACYELGIKAVAIYSEEDKVSLFRTKADEAYLIGENLSPLGAYLDIKQIIDLAKRKGVDAIHPGYGFLSENAEFAKACEEAGIKFIGPSSDILSQMGDKINAKNMAIDCGVPTIPGSKAPLQSEDEAVKLANEYGYPVILKAAAGGGGRGMRLANNDDEIRNGYTAVKNEALKAFGNDDIFIEKYLVNPKHIEVQILGDEHGNIVHLFERDCSVQRRYQKVVEYAPAFSVDQKIRDRLYADAIKIAEAVNYKSAGTVEFLVDAEGNHYFIEMNPRIQVEHTVTEMVTDVDIVQSQILIAEGHSLDSPEIDIPSQDSLAMSGYSIQCRVTTEDPRNNFLPDTGKITTYRSSGGFGIRLDAGNAFVGAEITPYYDSLLVKVTTHGRTFQSTINKALRGIGEIRVRGVKTNIAFLTNILTNETFKQGKVWTKFIDETPELFDIEASQDRGTKALKFIGDKIVNEGIKEKPHFDKIRIPAGYDSVPEANGPKKILDEKGPDAVIEWVKNQKKLLVTDTTFRDAHQSLLATRVRTRDMRTIARPTAHILKDAFSLEMWGGATFDVAYRFLKESPWARLDELREKMPNVLFQMLFRGANAVGYTSYPDNLIKEFIKESARSGIDVFRIFDSLNWLRNMELAIDEVRNQGKIAEGTICYTGDIEDPKRDKYSLNYYIKMAKEIEKMGAHMLAIKDMAGLLKPVAAKKLVTALKNEIEIPIHLHTHDTSGNQIAAYMLASDAGVDIVDCAISSMSSLTSQPSLNSLVGALEGQDRDTGMNLQELQKLTNYWEDVRPYYMQFESDLKAPNADIYRYEIPGGQYTNLKPQVDSLGLKDRFDDVKEKFREVNEMLGDIVKVTPSSKMVGDMAIFMVQNNLTKDNIVEKGADLNYPDSALSYFKGLMGQPEGGFPKDIQKIVLKGEEPITGKPGESLPPVDFESVKKNLKELSGREQTIRSAISWCLYPKVIEDYIRDKQEESDISRMETSVFFMGMVPGESTELSIEDGKTLMIKYIGPLEKNDDGTINLLFELNGIRREISILDKTAEVQSSQAVMADPDDRQQIGSSLPGAISQILVTKGETVKENQTLAVIEAMKMEVNIVSPMDGKVKEIHVEKGENVKVGELLITLE